MNPALPGPASRRSHGRRSRGSHCAGGRGRATAVPVAVAAGVLLLGSACGMGGDKSARCDETRQAFVGYSAQLKTIAPTDQAPWKKATEDLATRLDRIAAKTEDAALKKALKSGAAEARVAATAVGSSGDTANLQRMVVEQPARIGKACA